MKGRLTLELLDLLGGELRGEPAGSVLVVVEHRVLGLLLAARPNPNKIPRIRKSPSNPRSTNWHPPAQIRTDRLLDFLIGTDRVTTGSIRRLPAEDGGEGAEVELLRVGALGAVDVHDVHGSLLRRRGGGRVLLRLGRHGCCCCQEEEDQERATR